MPLAEGGAEDIANNEKRLPRAEPVLVTARSIVECKGIQDSTGSARDGRLVVIVAICARSASGTPCGKRRSDTLGCHQRSGQGSPDCRDEHRVDEGREGKEPRRLQCGQTGIVCRAVALGPTTSIPTVSRRRSEPPAEPVDYL